MSQDLEISFKCLRIGELGLNVLGFRNKVQMYQDLGITFKSLMIRDLGLNVSGLRY